jgi:hypothetical protein
MIGIKQQQSLLLNIARELEKQITVYAIGGTAMMFWGFKDATLDIDLVFENEADRKVFSNAAERIGYKEMDAVKVYGAKRNIPLMLKLDDERFDLFVSQVVDFVFSKEMQKRAEQIHQFGDMLILKIADPHDIILMKCATDRIKDMDDAIKIIDASRIDWGIIVNEAKNQIALGRETAAMELGAFFEKISPKLKQKIPDRTMDELWSILEKQAEEKIKKIRH